MAAGVHDHVVGVAAAERGEIGDGDEPVVVEAQEPVVEHRHDEQSAVGKPPEAGRAPIELDDGRRSRLLVDEEDPAARDIGEIETIIAPTRGLPEVETVQESREP